jgi:drug/metabolite transporter (DMT)-like permease
LSLFALALILAAAVIHAAWNYLLKRSGGGVVLVWWFAMLSAILYAPFAFAVLWWQQPELGWTHLALMFASAALHTAYYMLLDRGYRAGDLSLVYPLARGSGPLITVLCAIVVLQEQPSLIAITGTLLIGGGAVLLTGFDPQKLRRSGSLPAIAFALLTGCTIAAYTLVDKIAVSAYLIPPILQDWAANLGRVLLMTPLAMQARSQIMSTWRRARKDIIAIAVLCPLAYILVLTAMVFTPVSYAAPAREISILFAAIMGTQLLAEGDEKRRLMAAAAMVAGITCLALG